MLPPRLPRATPSRCELHLFRLQWELVEGMDLLETVNARGGYLSEDQVQKSILFGGELSCQQVLAASSSSAPGSSTLYERVPTPQARRYFRQLLEGAALIAAVLLPAPPSVVPSRFAVLPC